LLSIKWEKGNFTIFGPPLEKILSTPMASEHYSQWRSGFLSVFCWITYYKGYMLTEASDHSFANKLSCVRFNFFLSSSITGGFPLGQLIKCIALVHWCIVLLQHISILNVFFQHLEGFPNNLHCFGNFARQDRLASPLRTHKSTFNTINRDASGMKS